MAFLVDVEDLNATKMVLIFNSLQNVLKEIEYLPAEEQKVFLKYIKSVLISKVDELEPKPK